MPHQDPAPAAGRRRRRTASTALLVAAAAITLAACSASKKSSSSAGSAMSLPSAPAASSAGPAEGGFAANGPVASAPPGAAPAAAPSAAPASGSPALLANRSIVYTGDITLVVDDVDIALAKVHAEADTVAGVIDAEHVALQPKDADGNGSGQASASVTLHVPPDSVRTVMSDLAKIGTETSQNLHEDDVTAQVADVGARITAAQASLKRLDELFQHAGTVAQLADVEAQIAQREADLESLESQQKALAAEVSYATITVNLQASSAPPPVVPKPKKAHVLGFVRGLHGGWHAFTAAVSGLATALGALLPFLAVLAALASLGLVIWRRSTHWRRTRSPATTPQP